MIFGNGNNFKNFDIKLKKSNKLITFEQLLKKEPRQFKFSLQVDNEKVAGEGIRGDDAVWIPVSEYGYKIIGENPRYDALNVCYDNIKEFQKLNLNIFPKIHWVEKVSFDDKQYLLLKIENVKECFENRNKEDYFLPLDDKKAVSKLLQCGTTWRDNIVESFYSHNIKPEDEWYKKINFINGKIVDFHRFTISPERYFFDSNGKTKEELQETYKQLVGNYSKVIDHNGAPKWKGKIYQGFNFDNGYSFRGYSSNSTMYDSYKKLPFIPYGKVKNKKVLDIGSNQGFFSFQAAIHGASEVVGIERQKEDVIAANEIKKILGYDNVSFKNLDAVKYIMDSNDKYGLVIANSVLHQIYKNLEGKECDALFKKLASDCEYFAFESPVNHPTMRINMSQIYYKLTKYFKVVRLLNVYDAYSSGYRANFVCYA